MATSIAVAPNASCMRVTPCQVCRPWTNWRYRTWHFRFPPQLSFSCSISALRLVTRIFAKVVWRFNLNVRRETNRVKKFNSKIINNSLCFFFRILQRHRWIRMRRSRHAFTSKFSWKCAKRPSVLKIFVVVKARIPLVCLGTTLDNHQSTWRIQRVLSKKKLQTACRLPVCRFILTPSRMELDSS